MNNDIKEILDLLKYCVEKNEYLEEPHMKKWKPLLDYITNLQEELEDKAYKQLKTQCFVYKERIDKVLEYIDNNTYMDDYGCWVIDQEYKKDKLKNILEGDDKE